ncbi:unnamed protein product [Brassica rapa]|uniref:Uncharacterized protein n=2 Tax=Brassica campestris TaxID=3711 RepID=A0A8D9H047_BRACM|nr:unnamed protein product [Brassica rapa]
MRRITYLLAPLLIPFSMFQVSSSNSKRKSSSYSYTNGIDSMMKKMRMMMLLRRCKSVSTQLGRSYSYTSLRSQSARRDPQDHLHDIDQSSPTPSLYQTVFVGRTKKPYLISKQHLKHPLLNALVEKQQRYEDDDGDEDGSCVITVKCEVVLFDHLLWMLENGDQGHILESLDDFAHLYLSP